MAHSNETQYYGLPQYLGTDVMNPLTDTNGAYEAIDTALHEVALNSADASNKAEHAEDSVDAVDSRVGTLETQMNDVTQEQAQLNVSMAEAFSDTKQGGYKAGDFVTKDGKLYEFINDHAGTWSASDVVETTVADMLKKILGVIAETFDATKQTGYEAGDYVINADKLYKFVHDHIGAWNVSDVDEVTVASEMKASAGALAKLSGKTIDGQKLTATASGATAVAQCNAMKSALRTLYTNRDSDVADIVLDAVIIGDNFSPINLSLKHSNNMTKGFTVASLNDSGGGSGNAMISMATLMHYYDTDTSQWKFVCEGFMAHLLDYNQSSPTQNPQVEGITSMSDAFDGSTFTYIYHYVYNV